MATTHAHCHLNLGSPVGPSRAVYFGYSNFYYYAYQAMLEVRSSGD